MVDDVHIVTATTLPSTSSRVDASKPEPAKTLLGDRYAVGRRIGAGGMGEVHAARDMHLGREVAIKVVRPLVDATGVAQNRLVREARAMAKLRHANVVTLHDIGTVDDRIFIVMELVQGGTLAEWLKAQPRPWREIVALFLQAARGLAAAHGAGFVHLDFKPQNVLIGIDGVVRVTDFGVVRLIGDATSAAEAETGAAPGVEAGVGGVVGTPGYIAPEILRHEGVDARADQFSFCVALYEALYNERPFERLEGPSRIAETLGRPRSPPTSPGPRWLARIIARGLSASPVERFPTIDALAAAIDERLRRPQRRRAMVAAAAAIAIVVVVATRPAQPPRTLAPRVLFRDSELQRSRVADISRDGRILIFSAPGEVWLSPRDGVGRKPLQLPFSTSFVYNVVSIPGAPQRVVAELWTEHQGLGIWELTRDAPPVLRDSDTTRLLDVRADGTILGIAGEVGKEQLVLLDRFRHEPRILQSVEGVASARFSPDGGRVGYLAFQGPQGRVAVIEIATGTGRALDAEKGFVSLAWLDDQKLVAVERGPGWRPDGAQTDFAANHIVEIGVSGRTLRAERSLRVEQRGILSLVRITPEGALMRAQWTDGRLALVAADGSEATTAGAVLSRDHQLDSLIGYTDSGIVYQATRGYDSFVAIQRSDQTVELMDSARGLGTPSAVMADELLFIRRHGDSQSLILLTARGPLVLGTIGATARVACAGDRHEPCVIGERRGEKWQVRGVSAKMGIDARILIEAPLDQFPNQPALSIDGRTLAYGANGGRVGFFDLETGTTRFEEWQEPSGKMPFIHTMTWESASGLLAAECCSPSRVVRLTLGGPRTVLATSETLRYRSPRLAPDGRTVAVEAQTLDQTYLWIPELRAPK